MNAISRALKKGTQNKKPSPPSQSLQTDDANEEGEQAPSNTTQPVPTSPKQRKRRYAAMETSADPTPVVKQHLSVREGGDIDLGMLDQEAFARVIASGQQQTSLDGPKVDEEEDEDDVPEVVDDVTYRPSGTIGEGADPIWALRMTCLPVLDVFSTELLKILSSHQHSMILQIVTGTPASPISHNYIALLHLFDATKKQLYSQEPYQAFLDPDILGFKDIQERKVIRKVNLATFLSSVFGSVDVGFFHLNEGFITTMAPDGGRLLKDMARLFLDLKTQAYISAMGQPSRDQNSILNDLFPSTAQLTHLFVSRRQPQNTLAATASQDDLTPAETEFITKCERRRENLRALGDGEKQVQELKEKYSWETFLRELRAYVAKNWEIIVGSRGGKPRRPTKKRVSAPAVPEYEDAGMGFIAPVQQQGVPTEISVNSQGQPIWEAYEKARLIPPSPIVGAVVTSAPVATGIPPPQTPVGKVTAQGNTPRNASEGNQVRRPWTKDEESALFAGLEAVQGPNWAAILQLYGPGGSISEALKDRSQVQLKDKARNLKLFFLKGGHEVPRVLERVTGRLKGEHALGDGETPMRRKRRRTGEASGPVESYVGMPSERAQYGEGQEWQSTSQGQEFEMGGVATNVDPGLQMPQGS